MHWQHGGMVVGTKRQLFGGPPVKLHANDGGAAPASRMLLERAADVVEGIEDSRSMAYEGAVDPIGGLAGLVGRSGPLAEEQDVHLDGTINCYESTYEPHSAES
ncbi:DNA primase RepB-like protein [Azospirillum brasilense]|nr:DNA-primase RepB domain-containing protein [Azospirillum baldaniorum]TWA78079.1 DNA primase RepB-like protein [Azospirillum brasilense]